MFLLSNLQNKCIKPALKSLKIFPNLSVSLMIKFAIKAYFKINKKYIIWNFSLKKTCFVITQDTLRRHNILFNEVTESFILCTLCKLSNVESDYLEKIELIEAGN